MKKRTTEDFYSCETMYDTNGEYVSLHLSKLIECSTPGVNSKVNYELWVVRMGQCGVISHNKCTTLVGDVIMKESMHRTGQVYVVKLYLPFNYLVNLKLNIL